MIDVYDRHSRYKKKKKMIYISSVSHVSNRFISLSFCYSFISFYFAVTNRKNSYSYFVLLIDIKYESYFLFFITFFRTSWLEKNIIE